IRGRAGPASHARPVDRATSLALFAFAPGVGPIMSWFRCHSSVRVFAIVVALSPMSTSSRGFAQFVRGSGNQPAPVARASTPAGSFKEPTPSQVYQRDTSGHAAIPLVLGDSYKDSSATVVDASIVSSGFGTQATKLVD